jgi:hypothetical protein
MTAAPRRASTPGRTCSICYQVWPVCRSRWADDHDFLSITAARQATPNPDLIAQARASIKDKTCQE